MLDRMSAPSRESSEEVETGQHLQRKPLQRLRGDKNSDIDHDNLSAAEEDANANEGVDSSQEQVHASSGQTSRLKKVKKSKVKAPSKIYPEVPPLDVSEHKPETSSGSWIPPLDVPEDKPKTSSGSWIHALRHIIWPLLGFIASFFLIKFFQHSPETSSFIPPFDVDAVVSTLRQDFSSLQEKNFRVLKAALRGVNTESEPRAPAVLLLVSPEGDESTSNMFAKNLAKILDENYVLLSGTELIKSGNSKKHIDDTIRTNIEEKGAKVFLMSQLQKLKFDTTLIFHSFCDDQNAPFKRVVYVITVSCQSLNTSVQWDKIGMDCLSQAWPGIPNDLKDPLINRLTHSVMILPK